MHTCTHLERLDGEPFVSIVELGGARANAACSTYVLAAEQDLGNVDCELESVRLDHVRLRGSPWPVIVAVGQASQAVFLLSPFDGKSWDAIESWVRIGACYLRLEVRDGARTFVGAVEAFQRSADWDMWQDVDEAADIVASDALELARTGELLAVLVRQLALDSEKSTTCELGALLVPNGEFTV